MQVHAVVEIIPASDGSLPVELICRAYRASERGLVVLLLREVSPEAINRVLNPVVRSSPTGIPGVLYMDPEVESSVLEAVQNAEKVVVASEPFRAQLASWGVQRCDIYGTADPDGLRPPVAPARPVPFLRDADGRSAPGRLRGRTTAVAIPSSPFAPLQVQPA